MDFPVSENAIDDDEKELIKYEKQLREIYEKDLEAFVVQVYEEIEENKKRDIQAITDEAEVLAIAHRMGLDAKALNDYNARLEQLYISMEEYYASKFAEAKKISYCSAAGCKNERKTRCCFSAFYCSEECQKSHWRTHLRHCNREAFYATSEADDENEPPNEVEGDKEKDHEMQDVNDEDEFADALEGRKSVDSFADAQENLDDDL